MKSARGLVPVFLLLSLVLSSGPALADTPSPTPTPTPTPSATPSPTPSPEPSEPRTPAETSRPGDQPSAEPSTVSPTPEESPRQSEESEEESQTPTSPEPSRSAETPDEPSTSPSASTKKKVEKKSTEQKAATTISLKIAPTGTPQKGKYFSDIGYFAFSGKVSNGKAGQRVELYWWSDTAKAWQEGAVVKTTSGGAYSGKQKVGHAKIGLKFRTSLGGKPGSGGVTYSNRYDVNVRQSYIRLASIKDVDALKSRKISGWVYPARAGVTARLAVKVGGSYKLLTTSKTNKDGKFSFTFTRGKGDLASYRVRASYKAANRGHFVISPSKVFKRIAVLNAIVTKTTKKEVAKTYRSGCPVGPSKLRTVTMNFYGMYDKRIHRGMVIVRKDLTDEVIRGFNQALKHRFPIRKMNNPNVYGGNDPKMMKANNTSGFNCRKVTGNPYSQSPHSYGIAIDVNTVQNPYRDANGKWWPTNAKSYIDRTPRRFGMLVYNSYLTKQLRKDDFFWGGLWSPGRDYQHFEYDR